MAKNKNQKSSEEMQIQASMNDQKFIAKLNALLESPAGASMMGGGKLVGIIKPNAILTKPMYVLERKLGRERAKGRCYVSQNVIEVDARQNGQDYFETLLHESLHVLCPEWNEERVTVTANTLMKVAWQQNFRKVQD